MLKITIPDTETFDEATQTFNVIKGQTISLEHSLVSISKWESKWHKVYLDKRTDKTAEEVIDYIRCMTLTQNVDPLIYYCIPASEVKRINEYIEDPMTATWFSDEEGGGKGRGGPIITAEVIYYMMIAYQIPFECQKWHLNRLLTLLRVCEVYNRPKKKMRKNQILSRNAKLNAERKKKMGTRG